MESMVKCPDCGASFSIEAALAKEYLQKIDTENKHRYQKNLSQMQKTLDQEFEQRLKAEVGRLKEKLAVEFEDLKNETKEKTEVNQKLRSDLLEARKLLREESEKSRTQELEMQKKLSEQSALIRENEKRRVEDEFNLRMADKDKLISDMKSQIDELKRKSEIKSGSHQGEVLETTFEDQLRTAFPHDVISEVAKGTRGGDVIQAVRTQTHQHVGSVSWELKRTIKWQHSWIEKVKEDIRIGRYSVGAIVTQTMPPDTSGLITIVDGVLVAHISVGLSMALLIRERLLSLHEERRLLAVTDDKKNTLFNFVTSDLRKDFIQMAENLINQEQLLSKEQRNSERTFAQRRKDMEALMKVLAKSWGGIQGVIGTDVAPIKLLELDAQSEIE